MTTKTCNKCLTSKQITEFFKDKSNKTDGHHSQCKSCKTEKHNEWRNKSRDKYNASMREWRKNNRLAVKDLDLRRTYGIGLSEFNAMLEKQNNICAICPKPAQGKRPLVVDHHHRDRYIRELLCYGCNRDMSVVDNEVKLVKLLEYRDKHAAKNKKE